MKIVSSLRVVDQAFLSVDKDGSVCESIREISNLIKERYGNDTIVIF
jgi:hypothetical protein